MARLVPLVPGQTPPAPAVPTLPASTPTQRAPEPRGVPAPRLAPRTVETSRHQATTVAGAKVGTALDAQSTPAARAKVKLQPRQLGPLGDVFTLKPSEMSKVWARAPRAQATAAKLEKFRAELDACGGDKDQIAAFVTQHVGSDALTPEQSALMLERLQKKGMWAVLTNAYEQTVATTPSFAEHPIPAEHYLVALNKTEQFTKSVSHAKSLLTPLATPGRPLCAATIDLKTIERTPFVNGETLGALGSAFRSIADKAYGAQIEADHAATRGALDQLRGKPKSEKEVARLEARVVFLEELHRAVTGRGSMDPPVAMTDEQRALVRAEMGIAPGKEPPGFDYGQAALRISTQYYSAGYAADFEYYPGINALHNLHALGDAKALDDLRPLVAHSLLQAGGSASKDYWCLATQLEFALLGQDDHAVRALLPKVLGTAQADWEVGTTAKSIIKLIDTRQRTGGDTQVTQFVYDLMVKLRDGKSPLPMDAAQITQASKDLDGLLKYTGGLSKPAQAERSFTNVKQAALWEAISGRSTHFGEMSNHYAGMMLRGNVQYGGIVPDIKISRPDVELARAVIRELKLPSITEANAWNTKVDNYLAPQLHLVTSTGKRPLEDLHSAEHEYMDQVRQNILSFAGVDGENRKTRSSKTNLMASVAMGCVDCRETAFSKQLIYDVCKKNEQNALKREAYEALQGGDTQRAGKLMQQVEALDGQQLVTLSAMIRAPIEMAALYKPILSEDGARVRNEKVDDTQKAAFTDVENHTFNALVSRNADGSLSLEWRDAFYQELYQWSRLPVVPDQVFEATGFVAGTMTPLDDKGRQIPVQAVLTPYSKGTIVGLEGEHGGSVHVFGLEAQKPDLTHLRKPDSLGPLLDALARGPGK